jgi:class 3 adenylate cyclase
MDDRLPAGTVTLVFTDIEGSTRLLHELGAEAYSEALAEHRRVLREAFGRHLTRARAT